MTDHLTPEMLADYTALDFAELMDADAAAVVSRMRDLLVGEIARLKGASKAAQLAEAVREYGALPAPVGPHVAVDKDATGTTLTFSPAEAGEVR